MGMNRTMMIIVQIDGERVQFTPEITQRNFGVWRVASSAQTGISSADKVHTVEEQ